MIPLTWLAELPRWAMRVAIGLLLGAVIWNAGAARQGSISITTADSANWCASILDQTMLSAERAALLLQASGETQAAFLAGRAGGVE